MINISTPTQEEQFRLLLQDAYNCRIVLSAPFGSGKTTFLKKYFQSEENDKSIFLYPVNYSVASNKDVFELIKYDILSQILMWEDITNYITDISTNWGIYSHLINDPMKVIIPIAEAIGDLGGVTGQVAKISKGLYNLKEELEKIAEQSNEGDEIHKFMSEIESQSGCIYQKDIVTLIIKSILKRVKESNSEIRTTLIIDDLDRIDPEHLFRILNILASHSDVDNEGNNKFGFDKIITVFDIENVKQIFGNKYGEKADFIGYINKFYSRGIFQFDLTCELVQHLHQLFNETMVEHSDKQQHEFWGGDAYKRVLPLLTLLIEAQKIGIRDIIQMAKIIKANETYAIKSMSNSYDHRWGENQPYFIAYEFLINLLGGREELRNVLIDLKRHNHKRPIIWETDYNLSLVEIFSDYLNICLNAIHDISTIQSKKSALLNLEIYYYHRGGHSFDIKGAFDLEHTSKMVDAAGVPIKYQLNPKEIEINVWGILLEIIDKVEQKIYS